MKIKGLFVTFVSVVQTAERTLPLVLDGAVSSIGFALVLHLGVLGFLKFLLWVVFVDCIGVGLLLATVMW